MSTDDSYHLIFVGNVPFDGNEIRIFRKLPIMYDSNDLVAAPQGLTADLTTDLTARAEKDDGHFFNPALQPSQFIWTRFGEFPR